MKRNRKGLIILSFLLMGCSPMGKETLLKEVKENPTQIQNLDKWNVESIRFNNAENNIKNILNKVNQKNVKPLMYLSYKVSTNHIQYAFLVQDGKREKIWVITQNLNKELSLEEVDREAMNTYLGIGGNS